MRTLKLLQINYTSWTVDQCQCGFYIIIIYLNMRNLILLGMLLKIAKLISISLDGIKTDSVSDLDQNSISIYPNTLIGAQYNGYFKSSQENILFDYIDSKQGSIRVNFLYDNQIMHKGLNAVVVTLFDPFYHDLKAVLFQLQLPAYQQQVNGWSSNQSSLKVYAFNQLKIKTSYECLAKINIQNPDKSQLSINQQNFVISISSLKNDTNCNFSFEAQVSYSQKKIKTLKYICFITALIVVQIISAGFVVRNIKLDKPGSLNISLLTIVFLTIKNIYCIIQFLLRAVNEPQYQNYYILPISLLILSTIGMNMRILLLLWKKQKSNVTTPDARCNPAFYVFFYLGIIIYETLALLYAYNDYIMMFQSLLYLPQIYKNSKQNSKTSLDLWYLVGFLSVRNLVSGLYERGCPQNVFAIHPSLLFCCIWLALHIIQVAILILQNFLGTKFFIPKRWIPGYFDYQYNLKANSTDTDECYICLNVLHQDPEYRSQADTLDSLKTEMIVSAIVIRTPCKHMFHKSCFKQWIQVKRECPNCREKLPQFIY